MSRILIIYRTDIGDINNSGVYHKMIGQKHAFENLGFQVDTITQKQHQILLNQQELMHIPESEPPFIFQYRFFKRLKKQISVQKYDLLWIRYGLSIPTFINFIKLAKAQKPGLKIFLDLPTYPYSKEWKGVSGKLVMVTDRIFRRQLNKYVDWIVFSGRQQKLWNIPVYHMSNGIDPNLFKAKTKIETNEEVHLLAIGKWNFWHGVDRIIYGISEYVKDPNNPKIVLHVVGEGPNLKTLKDLVTRLDISRNIVFEGPKTREDIESIAEGCQIGIGTMGLHRKGRMANSSLKHREYCARGLPFILSGPDEDFPEELIFVQYHQADDSPIPINKVMGFYKRYKDNSSPQFIRKYALEHLSWGKKLKKLIKVCSVPGQG